MLPPIPAKRYFTIGEVSDLCNVKPHVLRYWEQEFAYLRPMKRRGNRRYYQHHEVLMIRRIRDLLYEQGFTIHGARNKLQEMVQAERLDKVDVKPSSNPSNAHDAGQDVLVDTPGQEKFDVLVARSRWAYWLVGVQPNAEALQKIHHELLEIRQLLIVPLQN